MYFVLMYAHSGYRQVKLSERSAQKTPFFDPGLRKIIWLVIPFGLRNVPDILPTMVYDFKKLWNKLCKKHGMKTDRSNNITIIMDGVISFATPVDRIVILLFFIYKIARKYHLSWKLTKYQ